MQLFQITMIIQVIILSLLSLVIASPAKLKENSPKCGYKSCHPLDDTKINVHLVPHSHDDVGWLQTVDRYYFGTSGYKSSEHAGVQYIISSTVQELKKNPDRRFIQVETAFFWKWWQLQDDETKQTVRDLVENGQLEMVNGAWSMNDEAASHYQSIIDQFTWGFRTLDDTIGGSCAKPKIGWQIDPFGHSREHASIVKQLGFEGLVIGRLDFRDKEKRKQNKALDFIWETSPNLDNSNLFTSMFPNFYTTESGYCWDITCNDQQINDNPNDPYNNLAKKVNNFVAILDKYCEYYQTKNILIPMGGDFQFQQAEINFGNIDKFIKGFENHPKYNVIYSTPSCYIKAVNDEVRTKSITLPRKSDDFFPYASNTHAFWTGFYTSRPTSKRFERTGNNILQAAKQLTSFSRINAKDHDSSIVALREAMGILQHHDAITGTEKQFVADDYARILTEALKEAEAPMGVIVGDLLKKEATSDVDLKLETCWLANVSICEPSNANRFMVAVYNPLGRIVSHYVRLPVGEGTYQITGVDGDENYDLMDSISSFDYMPDETHSPKELVFKAQNLPPLGIKYYYIEKTGKDTNKEKEKTIKDDYTYGTETNGFTMDPDTKLLKSVTIQGKTLQVKQEFLYYESYVGVNSGNTRSSGAYTFRPKHQEANSFDAQVVMGAQRGKLVDEVKQKVSHQITQIIRAYKSEQDSHIEFDWLIGDLKTGTEVITRFTVEDFSNQGIFFTDSNGRELIKRELNKRNDYEYDSDEEPVTSNYYPITSKIVIKDETKKLQVAILNDRSQGGTSLKNGTIELMVHRRLQRDDGYGVSEALNEVQFGRGLYARGQHFLSFGPTGSNASTGGTIEYLNSDEFFVHSGKSTAAWERNLAQKKLLAPWVLVADATSEEFSLENIKNLINFSFQGLKASLPENVHILTFEPWRDDSFLLRLEHILEKEEDDHLSTSVTVNLKELFATFPIREVREYALGGNQVLNNGKEGRLVWNKEEETQKLKVTTDKNNLFEITLRPMQIRTFIFTADVEVQEDHDKFLWNKLKSYFF